ncbi:MAG: glycoside hydrolase domain-containing protein [Bryobacteraceae bacterium]
MRPILIMILLATQTGSRLAASEPSPLRWWIVDPLEKIKPLDAVPNSPVTRADLHAGRNEFEPFQIVLRADDADIADIDIEVSDLRTSRGTKISRNNVTAYLEQFLNITQPSLIGGATGLWPDPLIPRIDRYAHERRNAFPFVLRRGRNQPLWVEIFVPEQARPGKYLGWARISRGGKSAVDIPISLTVWAFVLPSTATLKSSFGLSGPALLQQHRGQYTNDDDLYSLTRVYAKAALEHRISIHGGSMVPPPYRLVDGRMRLDWQAYDAEVGPFLDGTAIPKGEPLSGARATSVDLRTPSRFPHAEQQAPYWAESVRHFRQSGWYDRLFLYLWDEPAPADKPMVLVRGRAALLADPGIRNLVTSPFTPEFKEVVQIWTPLVNCLVRKPGFDDFCAEAPPMEVYLHEAEGGKSLWFYQSCASHGCNMQGGSYFTGWPSYMIDASGVANRVMQWLAWKYRIEGELYFSMDEAYGRDKDPWTDVRLFGGNGDGTLFYPGRPDRIGGLTDIPIESIRLKLIREGMEDYEYLALLAKLGGQKAADKYADRIVKQPYLWESSPEIFLRVRLEMGKALDRLVSLRPESVSNEE